MSIFEFLKFLPKAALLFLPITLLFFGFAIFSLFKKGSQKEKKEEETEPMVSLRESFEPTPPPKKKRAENLLLILTIILLILSLPLAMLLVEQKQEIRMKAEVGDEITPTPTEAVTPIPPSQCDKIKIYYDNWEEVVLGELPKLQAGQTLRIAVKGDPDTFDKGRIRINSMEWKPENETSEQNQYSPGEFYIECEVGTAGEKATICGISTTAEDVFKIEAELHDKKTGQWR